MSRAIAEDLTLQRRTWVAERIGWIVFAAIIVAALLGLFGPGLLGPARAEADGGSLSVEYPRFARMQSPTTVRVQLDVAEAADGPLRLWLRPAYLEGLTVEQVTPEPVAVEVGADRVQYVFDRSGAAGPVSVSFVLEAGGPGLHRGEIGAGTGEATVRLWQFFYP